MTRKAGQRLSQLTAKGMNAYDAWNKASVLLVKAAEVWMFCQLGNHFCFYHTLYFMQNYCWNIKISLDRLGFHCLMIAYFHWFSLCFFVLFQLISDFSAMLWCMLSNHLSAPYLNPLIGKYRLFWLIFSNFMLLTAYPTVLQTSCRCVVIEYYLLLIICCMIIIKNLVSEDIFYALSITSFF